MATTHSDTEKASPSGRIIDRVGPHLGQAPLYELDTGKLADALGYIAKKIMEDNSGKVLAEVERKVDVQPGEDEDLDEDEDADEENTDDEAAGVIETVSFTMWYTAPVKSVLSAWEQEYAEELEDLEQSIERMGGTISEYLETAERVKGMGKWERFRFSLSIDGFVQELAERSIVPFWESQIEQSKARLDSLRAEIDAFRKNGYRIKENNDGTTSTLYPYAVALTVEASAGDSALVIKVHDQEAAEETLDEAASLANYRAGLMLAGALVARMPAGLEVVLEPAAAEWGYETPLDEPQDGDTGDEEESTEG